MLLATLGYKATKPQFDAVWEYVDEVVLPMASKLLKDARFKLETWKTGKSYAVIRDEAGRFVKRIALAPDLILRAEKWATGEMLVQRDRLGRFVRRVKLD